MKSASVKPVSVLSLLLGMALCISGLFFAFFLFVLGAASTSMATEGSTAVDSLFPYFNLLYYLLLMVLALMVLVLPGSVLLSDRMLQILNQRKVFLVILFIFVLMSALILKCAALSNV
ncbi:MAG: hypothetical protein AB7P76_00890 [Candidatus Melainabacteria bacterium]